MRVYRRQAASRVIWCRVCPLHRGGAPTRSKTPATQRTRRQREERDREAAKRRSCPPSSQPEVSSNPSCREHTTSPGCVRLRVPDKGDCAPAPREYFSARLVPTARCPGFDLVTPTGRPRWRIRTRISHSLVSVAQCPLSFKLNYIDKLPSERGPPLEPATFGAPRVRADNRGRLLPARQRSRAPAPPMTTASSR